MKHLGILLLVCTYLIGCSKRDKANEIHSIKYEVTTKDSIVVILNVNSTSPLDNQSFLRYTFGTATIANRGIDYLTKGNKWVISEGNIVLKKGDNLDISGIMYFNNPSPVVNVFIYVDEKIVYSRTYNNSSLNDNKYAIQFDGSYLY